VPLRARIRWSKNLVAPIARSVPRDGVVSLHHLEHARRHGPGVTRGMFGKRGDHLAGHSDGEATLFEGNAMIAPTCHGDGGRVRGVRFLFWVEGWRFQRTSPPPLGSPEAHPSTTPGLRFTKATTRSRFQSADSAAPTMANAGDWGVRPHVRLTPVSPTFRSFTIPKIN